MIEYVLNNHEKFNNDELYEYLVNHDNDFPIPVSLKTNLSDYSDKLKKYGNIIYAIRENKIIGIIGYYDNNTTEKIGFISILSVDKDYRGRGIAKTLVQKVIDELYKKNFKFCDVPTHDSNIIARKLYESKGFDEIIFKRDDKTLILRRIV